MDKNSIKNGNNNNNHNNINNEEKNTIKLDGKNDEGNNHGEEGCCKGGKKKNKNKKKNLENTVKNENDKNINSVFLGENGVGKTSLINRIKGIEFNFYIFKFIFFEKENWRLIKMKSTQVK